MCGNNNNNNNATVNDERLLILDKIHDDNARTTTAQLGESSCTYIGGILPRYVVTGEIQYYY